MKRYGSGRIGCVAAGGSSGTLLDSQALRPRAGSDRRREPRRSGG